MSDTALEAAINGDLPQLDQAEPPAEAQAEPVEETAQAETPEEATGDKEASPPPGDEVAAFKAKAIDETRKRQAAEQRLAQFEQSMQQRPAEPPDFWADPDKALANVAGVVQQQVRAGMTQMSQDMMRMAHPDYDELEAEFIDAANADPSLAAAMAQSANPAMYAYQWAQQQRQIAQYSDPQFMEKHEAELREKIRAELEAEMRGDIDAQVEKRRSLPGSIANDRGAGGGQMAPARPDLNELIGN